jgi:hypothetical protein
LRLGSVASTKLSPSVLVNSRFLYQVPPDAITRPWPETMRVMCRTFAESLLKGSTVVSVNPSAVAGRASASLLAGARTAVVVAAFLVAAFLGAAFLVAAFLVAAFFVAPAPTSR